MSFWLTDERLAGHWAEVVAPDWKERWPDYARFTPWLRIRGPRHPIRWEDGEKRGENDVTSYAGVYVVARFDNAPAGPADPFDPAVDYIGRTRTAALGSRWRQFLNAAQGGGVVIRAGTPSTMRMVTRRESSTAPGSRACRCGAGRARTAGSRRVTARP